MKVIFSCITIGFFLMACNPKNNDIPNKLPVEDAATETWNGFRKIEPVEIRNPIQLIGKEWMLITSGNDSSFNTMTASWGGIGEIWYKPVTFITVRDTRYTYEFLKKNEYYTLTFFDESYKNILNMLGTKSGRDTDKIKESGLTSVSTPTGSVSFTEAQMIIECRKLYADPINKENILDNTIVEKTYGSETAPHTLFIGEIVNVWVK